MKNKKKKIRHVVVIQACDDGFCGIHFKHTADIMRVNAFWLNWIQLKYEIRVV